MIASDELRQIADALILVDPDAYERLHRIANDVAVLERGLDDMAVDARQIERKTERKTERKSHGLTPIGHYTETLRERVLRLSSQEKL